MWGVDRVAVATMMMFCVVVRSVCLACVRIIRIFGMVRTIPNTEKACTEFPTVFGTFNTGKIPIDTEPKYRIGIQL